MDIYYPEDDFHQSTNDFNKKYFLFESEFLNHFDLERIEGVLRMKPRNITSDVAFGYICILKTYLQKLEDKNDAWTRDASTQRYGWVFPLIDQLSKLQESWSIKEYGYKKESLYQPAKDLFFIAKLKEYNCPAIVFFSEKPIGLHQEIWVKFFNRKFTIKKSYHYWCKNGFGEAHLEEDEFEIIQELSSSQLLEAAEFIGDVGVQLDMVLEGKAYLGAGKVSLAKPKPKQKRSVRRASPPSQ